jgi:hypothetical protein
MGEVVQYKTITLQLPSYLQDIKSLRAHWISKTKHYYGAGMIITELGQIYAYKWERLRLTILFTYIS